MGKTTWNENEEEFQDDDGKDLGSDKDGDYIQIELPDFDDINDNGELYDDDGEDLGSDHDGDSINDNDDENEHIKDI